MIRQLIILFVQASIVVNGLKGFETVNAQAIRSFRGSGYLYCTDSVLEIMLL